MLRNSIKRLSKGGVLLASVVAAAVIGGAATGLVMAAIPSSSGTISTCYNTKSGALKVIDAEAGKTCTAKQTALSWNVGVPTVYDASGQALGTMLNLGDTTSAATAFDPEAGEGDPLEVFNSTLNRMVPIVFDGTMNGGAGGDNAGLEISPYYESTDCTGQAYVGETAILEHVIKTTLMAWHNLDGSYTYATVADNASPASVTINSQLFYNQYTGHYECDAASGITGLYQLTSVTPPFTVPVPMPVKLSN